MHLSRYFPVKLSSSDTPMKILFHKMRRSAFCSGRLPIQQYGLPTISRYLSLCFNTLEQSFCVKTDLFKSWSTDVNYPPSLPPKKKTKTNQKTNKQTKKPPKKQSQLYFLEWKVILHHRIDKNSLFFTFSNRSQVFKVTLNSGLFL